MPTQIYHSSGVTTNYLYDGMGTRVKKSVGSTDTYYFGDHFEFKIGDGMPDEDIKYIFAGNLRVAQIKGSTRTYFHKDHLGSSTVMTNDSGYEIESSNYMPFGGMRDHSGTDTSAYKFTDQELDSENGLYNYNARLYDPIIGRFISPDTIVPQPFNPQSLNRYSYCLNNPLIYTDPSGHEEEEFDDEWNMYQAKLEYIFLCELYGGTIPNNLASTDFELWAFTMGLDPMNLDYNNYLSYKTQIEYLDLMNKTKEYLDTAGSIIGSACGYTADFIVGFGDGVSLGATKAIRNMWNEAFWDGNDSVNYDSKIYDAGKYTGYVWLAATAWSAGLYGGSNSVFYAGYRAGDIAGTLGSTIGQTPIGSTLNLLGITSRTIWALPSATFAANAKGTATAVLLYVDPRSNWLIEKAILSWRNIQINIYP